MASILVNGWFWFRPDTGSGQYLAALMHRLPALAPRHRFRLLVPDRDDRPASAPKPRSLPANASLHSVPLPMGPPAWAKVWWEQVAVPFYGRALRAELVWNPYWTAALWKPCPVVTTIHDLIPALLPEYRSSPGQKLYGQLASWAAQRARRILTVSHAARQDLQAGGWPSDRICVVPNGVHARHLSFDAAALRRRFNLPPRFFLYLGGYERRKNVAAVLRAFQRFRALGGDPRIGLVLAGSLPARDTRVLQRPQTLIRDLELEDNVRLLGFVDEGVKTALYQSALAYVFPSLYEGFGLTPLEAMQAGTPVITSRR